MKYNVRTRNISPSMFLFQPNPCDVYFHAKSNKHTVNHCADDSRIAIYRREAQEKTTFLLWNGKTLMQ